MANLIEVMLVCEIFTHQVLKKSFRKRKKNHGNEDFKPDPTKNLKNSFEQCKILLTNLFSKPKGLLLSLQGIQFIHTSDLKYHGALRSDTCLLNDRYTIRIALAGFKHAALKVLQHGRKKWHQQIFEPLKEAVTLDYQGQDIGSLGLILLEMFHTSIPKQGRHREVGTHQNPSKPIKILKTKPDFFSPQKNEW